MQLNEIKSARPLSVLPASLTFRQKTKNTKTFNRKPGISDKSYKFQVFNATKPSQMLTLTFATKENWRRSND
jgi:hypothetical protein